MANRSAPNTASESYRMLVPSAGQPATPERTFASPNEYTYERVPKVEQDARTSQEQSSDGSTPTGQKSLEGEPRGAAEGGMLTRRPFDWWFLMPMDVLLALTPLFFLIVAGICLSLNKEKTSKYGEDVKSITLLSPTIFPIVYAAILGRMLRRVALYKAERSTTIGTVERLVGCQSLFSTFERQFAYRRVDILGVSLLVAWLLSPLGGQFSLRLLTTEPFVVTVQDTVKYYPIEAYGEQTKVFNKDIAATAWPLVAPLYMSALLTSKQYLDLPLDQFGNIKIPDIFQLPSYSNKSPFNTWIEVPERPGPEYVSIIGMPTAGLPESGNTSFNLVSHYWSVKCEKLAFIATLTNATQNRTPSFDMIVNATSLKDGTNHTRFDYKSRWITSQGILRAANGSSSPVVTGKVSSAACRAFPLVVESRVVCRGRSCAVKAMQRLPRSTEDVIGHYEPSSTWFGTIAANMPGADQGVLQEDSTSSELIEHWIVNPNLSTFKWDRTSFRTGAERRWVNVAELSAELFSRRLQIAINTFWQSAIGSAVMMGNLTKADVSDLETSDLEYSWNTTELIGSRQDGEQYACNISFAIVTIAISLLLFIAAVASLVLGLLTKAPDTLGFVSTSARDNPYVNTPIPSHLNGLEAARRLRDVRIRIGDVNSIGDIGHVAFASIEAEPKRLSRTRLYD